MNLYHVLQVSRDASLTDIKSSYRRLAMKYHPDITKSDGKEFVNINFAYNILTDRYKRNFYDLFGEIALEQFRNEKTSFLFTRLFSPMNVKLASFGAFCFIVGLCISPYIAAYSTICVSFPVCSIGFIPFFLCFIILMILAVRTFFRMSGNIDFKRERIVAIVSCGILFLLCLQLFLLSLIWDEYMDISKFYYNIPYAILEIMYFFQSFINFLRDYATVYEFMLCFCNCGIRMSLFNFLLWDFPRPVKISIHIFYIIYLVLSRQIDIRVFASMAGIFSFYNITLYLIFTGIDNIYTYITHFIFISLMLIFFMVFQFQYFGFFRKKRRMRMVALPSGI